MKFIPPLSWSGTFFWPQASFFPTLVLYRTAGNITHFPFLSTPLAFFFLRLLFQGRLGRCDIQRRPLPPSSLFSLQTIRLVPGLALNYISSFKKFLMFTPPHSPAPKRVLTFAGGSRFVLIASRRISFYFQPLGLKLIACSLLGEAYRFLHSFICPTLLPPDASSYCQVFPPRLLEILSLTDLSSMMPDSSYPQIRVYPILISMKVFFSLITGLFLLLGML